MTLREIFEKQIVEKKEREEYVNILQKTIDEANLYLSVIPRDDHQARQATISYINQQTNFLKSENQRIQEITNYEEMLQTVWDEKKFKPKVSPINNDDLSELQKLMKL
jgi:hypothetical protein